MKLFFLILILPTIASAKKYVYKENDGATNIFYVADCNKSIESKGRCLLNAVYIRPKESSIQCSVELQPLYSGEAHKKGDSWIISSSGGGCGYTNTYTLSPTGMVQVKTSPKRVSSYPCESFAPKIYKMSRVKNNTIKAPLKGCQTITVLGI